MNNIVKTPIRELGYDFIEKQYIPEGKDEYYLRNIQNRSGIAYCQLSAYEIEVLVRNNNSSDNWNQILVSPNFNPELVKNNHFFGLVRIGKLENVCLSYSDLQLPVGIYNSTIISCDFGDNVVVQNVHYLAHYILGNEVILTNIDELTTTPHSKFGNGIIKDGEDESVRIWLEICNENGGRKVMPFVSMLPGDAWLWSKYRADDALLDKFKDFTEQEYKTARGYYGKIGDRTVIKNSGILKDVWIGQDAYIKGASKIKNVTIQSGEEGQTQIGEGSEIVNGIIGFGCRLFYGIKAIRFVMASHSQLKYGARLINSYLGNNATISCCEVLNSLIFPAHEQHHNNSFLCAALIKGQSNIPAGATLGSNHNSRAADGEFLAGRGFWPSLCVNIKHNCKFASFTILARGNYPYELDIQIPFSLVSHNESNDTLEIMVGYWFLYNMYALTRNAHKYNDRDQRIEKTQLLETDYLAPDTIAEIQTAIVLIETAVGRAYQKSVGESISTEDEYQAIGKDLLQRKDPIINSLEITVDNFEHTKRKTVLTKVQKGYDAFWDMLYRYGIESFLKILPQSNWEEIWENATPISQWENVGGQLIPIAEIDQFKDDIKKGKINSWNDVHAFYEAQGQKYEAFKIQSGVAILKDMITTTAPSALTIQQWLQKYMELEEAIFESIKISRAKDYQSKFRKMMYDSDEEMEAVIGKLEDNSFINEQEKALSSLRMELTSLMIDKS